MSSVFIQSIHTSNDHSRLNPHEARFRARLLFVRFLALIYLSLPRSSAYTVNDCVDMDSNNSLGLGGASPVEGVGVGGVDPPTTGFPDDPELEQEGRGWFATYNPKVKAALEVNLEHTLVHDSVVCCVRFSPDGKFLATGCNRTAQIYDTKTGEKTCVLVYESADKSDDLYIRSVCFSADGKYLATGAEDKKIRIWNIADKKIRNIFEGHQQDIYSLEFSSSDHILISGSGDKSVRIWSMHDGSSTVLTIDDADPPNTDAGVTSVALSINGRWVAAGSLDTVVRIWDVETGKLVERLTGHTDSVYSIAFTPDGKGLVSASLDETLKYWDVSGLSERPSECKMDLKSHKDFVLCVAVSNDGAWFASGSKDHSVQFWDARTGIVQCVLQGHKNTVISTDFSPTGNVLATGSGDFHARICELWEF
ncbi:hypothetical protein M413DRAFT_279528 [Hebeloma cylindrosporum]|uniref:Uncharacterized protein n=1 Tax=Hebeloma cylindrosporum TaxID=76867 RepID=A0A0C3BYU9_HEBCY|nr:hypothetical protein M413DRAFT_279528 [Hebeloma cylindrosporum h7]